MTDLSVPGMTALPAGEPRRTLDPSLVLRIGLPVALFCLVIWGWERYVTVNAVPHYILPAPSRIWATLIQDWPILSVSLLHDPENHGPGPRPRGRRRGDAGGAAQSVAPRRVLAVSLRRDPAGDARGGNLAAAADLSAQEAAVLACAWIVAFFPILSNTTLGLQSVDRNLLELFELYGATKPVGRRPRSGASCRA